MRRTKKDGFSLVELSIGASLLLLAVTLALSGYMYAMRNTHIGDIQNKLDIDVQKAMEHLKRDLRMSSLDKVHYFPEGASECQAISFPRAYDSTGDGITEKDSAGMIEWDETVIYHIRPGDPDKLIRTVFKNRDNDLNGDQRQAQLNSVVATGYGTSTFNSGNAKSYILFENLLDWKIIPARSEADCYESSPGTMDVTFGYALLDLGTRDVKFEVIGKDDASTGYDIGIDQVYASPSQSPREGEAQVIASQSAGTAAAEYLESGAEGNYHLAFNAGGVGSSVTLEIPNDRWEETNFDGGDSSDSTTIEFDRTLIPMDFVVRLEGNDDTWLAQEQTGNTGGSISNIAYFSSGLLPTNSVVQVHLNGSELVEGNSSWILYNGRKCQLKFQSAPSGQLIVKNVKFGKTDDHEHKVFSCASPTIVTFSNASPPTISPPISTNGLYSEWIDLEIVKTNNYLLEYTISSAAQYAHPLVWKSKRTTAHESIIDTPTTNNIEFNGVVGLHSVFASYATKGSYVSRVFDTHMDGPQYNDLSCNSIVPGGSAIEKTTLFFKVRTADDASTFDPDISSWDAEPLNSAPFSVSPYKRYVQWQAIMESDIDTGLKTPKLNDVTIDWNGQKQMVGIKAKLTTGPDKGRVKASVDGVDLSSALIVDLEIYDDPTGMKNTSRRVTSSLRAEISPRNTGL